MSSVIKQLMIYTNHYYQGAAVGTLLTIPAQFLVGRAMSANNKVILECEDRSSLTIMMMMMLFTMHSGLKWGVR